ncbi:hypothetical protein ACFYUD_33230 [Nocardia tengchongensis]|uniref:hypothetical protein n=1 Tax=Nocardia tengchongensis TaxID=2055889 RepID=UPI00369FB4F1
MLEMVSQGYALGAARGGCNAGNLVGHRVVARAGIGGMMVTPPHDNSQPLPDRERSQRQALTLADRIALYAQAAEIESEIEDEIAEPRAAAVALYERIVGVDTERSAPEAALDDLDSATRLSLSLRMCAAALSRYSQVLHPRHPALRPMYPTLVSALVANHTRSELAALAISMVEEEHAYATTQFGQTDPRSLAARRDTAWVYTASGRIDEGLALAHAGAADAAPSLHPDGLDAQRSRVCLAVCLSRAGQPDTAIGICEQVLAKPRPHESAALDIPITRLALGLAQLAAGGLDAATATCESAAAELYHFVRRTPMSEEAHQLAIPAGCLQRYCYLHTEALSGPPRKRLTESLPIEELEGIKIEELEGIERNIAVFIAEFGVEEFDIKVRDKLASCYEFLDRPADAAAMYAEAANRSGATYGPADDQTLTLRARQILAGWDAEA